MPSNAGMLYTSKVHKLTSPPTLPLRGVR
uniref:Uncharacterized protein n=1 Tax=Anguilla anguilla TaxID=7936 RepID=A0A0E9VYI5_ANGAN